jgi:hypothetical protein
VILHQEQRDGVDRGSQRSGLLEDVDAVLLPLDHSCNAAYLALKSGQSAQELDAILRIATGTSGSSLRGGGCVRHTGWEYSLVSLRAFWCSLPWATIVMLPMVISVGSTCAKIGLVSGQDWRG